MPRKAHAQGGEGATPRGVRRRTRLNLLIEPQFGRNRGVVAGTRAMISSRLDRPVTVRREDLVEASVAAELAGSHVHERNAAAREVERHGKVRQLQASTEVSRQRASLRSPGKYCDHSPYASRAPGPSLVRVVDIRGPRSRPPRDD